ncbi:MAG: phenylalanine--tRNA ligase subunit alpha [Candidatus Dojkabacteria bacterium]|nr:phenylalanine--tRNA ligase subunit alpha [Candidatus Dojkabacteria bacterium]
MNKQDFINSINDIRKNFESEISSIVSYDDLKQLKSKYIGRSSALNNLLCQIKYLPIDVRAECGSIANTCKHEIESKIKVLYDELCYKTDNLIDPTANPHKLPVGHQHFTTRAIDEITEIFERIGFYRVRYPEVEWDWFAFESLNMPKDHPARDEWETFFIDNIEVNEKYGRRILTPHTSSGQVREMLRVKPPIRMINISKCYRRQIDVSHTPMFHQFEGLVIDKGVNISHLKGVLDYFVTNFFGNNRKARIRPYHFRFTEPSFEVDVSCGICLGEGCKLCKNGWLEIGGAGMVHPVVLQFGNIDPNEYSGFAFGFGIERNYMMKSGISVDDIRLIYQNDIRFLTQF